MAFLRSAQRAYERSALEARFENFDFNWESKFSRAQLSRGRLYYTSGFVKTLEVHANYASASLKIDGETEAYCVIDFNGADFALRGSSRDDELNAACAVACMYELEELLADEIPALKPEAKTEDSNPDSEASEPEKDSKIAPKNEEAMPLVLIFSLKKEALTFTAFWKTPKGLSAAFSKGSSANLNYSEREKIVRLARLARKSNFTYKGKCHVCEDNSSFASFVNVALAQWRKYFEIQHSEDLEMLMHGVKDVELNIELALDEDLNLRPSFSGVSEGFKLDFEELKLLQGRDCRCRIIQNKGLLRLSNRDDKLLGAAKRAIDFFGGKIPRYMLFTLFDEAAKLSLSSALSEWKREVLAPGSEESWEPFLRPYQREGAGRMLRLFKCGCSMLLSDEMGLGKTVQTLSVISKFYGGGKRFLIVCPASVIAVWESEAKKFFPHFKCKVLGANSDLSEREGALWLSSYTQLRRNRQKLDSVEFEIAVLDEAQYIKNPDSKVSEAACAIKTKHKVALSGTPIENRLLDMWSIFRWLMPGLMSTKSEFERRIADEPDFANRLKTQIAPFVMRRLKSEVAAELPAKIFVDLPCVMSEMQSQEYLKLLDSARTVVASGGLGERGGRVSVLSLLTRLRQAACDPALLPWIGASCDLSNSGKIKAISDALSSIVSSSRKAVIFSQFTSFLNRIRAKIESEFPEAKLFELTGSTRNRSEPVADFQREKSAAIMLVSLRAGGTGITLTGADYVFLADPWWNPAVEEQAIDRVHRIGKHNDVFIYRLISQNTVEESVQKLQQKKRELFNDILGELPAGGRSFEEAVRKILEI